MIPVYKISPSQIGSFDGCAMKWFIGYVLGYRDPSGKAALLGSAAHKVLEGVALCKMHHQGESAKTDKVLGRIGKKLKIDDWKDKSFAFYKKESNGLLVDSDKKTLDSHISKTIDHPYFPFNLEVVSAEKYFSLSVDQPWAKYNYNGAEGTLKINGVVDIIFRKDNELCYMDYKFGASTKDFNTDEKITYEYLHQNTQLCIYYWAIQKLLNEKEPINPYIWYAAQNKIYSLSFDNDQLEIAEKKLQAAFLKMKAMTIPSCNYSFKCKMCHYSKTLFSEYGRSDLDFSFTNHAHFPAQDGKMVMCDAISKLFKHRTVDIILENCKHV